MKLRGLIAILLSLVLIHAQVVVAQVTPGSTPLSISKGGTGGATAATARTNLGITATGADTTYAFRANNLSDLANPVAAFKNLGGRTKLPTGATNFYANSSGTGCGGGGCSDSNDGLTQATAKKTVLGALLGILNGYDFQCNVAAQSTAQINMLANEVNAGQNIHFGPHDYPGACAGGSVIIDGGGFTLEYDNASGSGPIVAFFGPLFQVQNLTIVNSLGACISEFEHASIRFGTGVVFANCLTSLQLFSEAVATFQNNFTISTTGTVSTFVTADENSLVTFGAGITGNVSGTPTYSVAMFVADSGVINMNSLSWSGNAPSGSKFTIIDGGAIFNGAASIPAGGAGTTASGGTADGAAVAITAGGTGATTASSARSNLGLTATAIAATGQLPGTTTNDNATAGNIGEFVFSEVLIGSEVTLTSGAAANVTSISLTAGDWDVYGNISYDPAGTTTIQSLIGWTSATSATLPTRPNKGAMTETTAQITTGQPQTLTVGAQRLSLSGTTTVFLSTFANFGVSTLKAYGFLEARRRR